jgi:hypothetical protein
MGVVNKRFKERWFVLSGNKLFYYKSQSANNAIHFIPLEDSFIRVSQEYPNSPCFEIVTGSRIFQLVAPSFPAMHEWIQYAKKYSTIYVDNNYLFKVEQEIVNQEKKFTAQEQNRIISEKNVLDGNSMIDDGENIAVNNSNTLQSNVQSDVRLYEDDEPWIMTEYEPNEM